MLAVEQDPVEPGIGDELCRDAAGEAAPQSDLQPSGRDRVLELVAGQIHRGLLWLAQVLSANRHPFRRNMRYTNWTAMPPSGPKSACSVSPFCANTTRVNE